MNSYQFEAFNQTSSLSLATVLTYNNQFLGLLKSKSLGKNISPDQILNNILSIASSVPLACFANTNSSILVNLLNSMDLDNMNQFRKGLIGAKVKF